MTARYIVGDCFDVLTTLEPASVDLVVTSPPFLALRSYLPADHEHKGKELGSEATPGAFIDRLLDVVEACARVLAPHGSLVFELGDTYAGSGGAGGDYGLGGLRDGAPKFNGSALADRKNKVLREDGNRLQQGKGWPLDKSKVLIPQLFAIALAYGFNPLTGRQTEPWRVRNTVAWCRPNPPVGRDGDKFRPATSFLTVACKARDRYWDGDAVRQPLTERAQAELVAGGVNGGESYHQGRGADDHPRQHRTEGTDYDRTRNRQPSPAGGAPLLDYWILPTEPYRGSHYATFPRNLVVPLVKTMCPPGGTVLDPFAGSGTTLLVADGHGRNAIGIDLDERNALLAQERCGMFLTVEHLNAAHRCEAPAVP